MPEVLRCPSSVMADGVSGTTPAASPPPCFRDSFRPGRRPGRLRARFSLFLPALAAFIGVLGLFAAGPAEAQSSDGTLRALNVEVSTDGVTFSRVGIHPEFSAAGRSFDTVVSTSHTHVRVTATANQSGATLKVGKVVGGRSSLSPAASGSPSGAIVLADGANLVRIEVAAPDGVGGKNYYVTVTRGGRANPAPPRHVKATAGAAKLTLTWTAPVHWGSFPATGYEVDWYAGASPPTDDLDWNRATPTVSPLPATATSYEFTGTYGDHTVAGGTTYQLQIRALSTNPDDNSDHLVSEWVTQAGTPPSGPSRSSDARLSGLTASSGTSSTSTFSALMLTPSSFSAATTDYTALVANAQTHVKLTPTVSEENATVGVRKGSTGRFTSVKSGSASTAIALDEGTNAITVRVTAEDGSTTKDYTVTLTQQVQQRPAAPRVTLSAAPNPVVEGSPVTVTAVLSAALSSPVTIPLTISDNSAEPSDHGTLAGITIASGATSGTGTITTNQDTDTEEETFTVTLGALPSEVTEGTPGSVQIRITDDDSGGGGTVDSSAPDRAPSFGGATVPAQSYVQYTAITALVLPGATGGDGTLIYRLTPAPPSGLSLDAGTRSLTGTPDTAQGSRQYTWTVRDADGDEARLTFAIEVEEDLMPSFGDATVADQSWTAGTAIAPLTLPAATGGDGELSYRLRPELPSGLALDAGTRTLTGTPDTAQGSRQYTWTVRDAGGDEARLTFAIEVEEDLMPSFGDATVADQSWTAGTAVAALTLPAATGGDGELSYRLRPELPSGLALDAGTRTLTGTPDTAQGSRQYTWTVRDADGDEARLTFAIEVEEDLMPSFGDATVADQSWTAGTAVAALTLPAATGGDGELSYRLRPELPSGLALDAGTRTLTGTPDTAQGSRQYTWTVRDADGDEARLTFAIEVEEDLMPSFGDATVADQSWTAGTAVAALTLPAATGGRRRAELPPEARAAVGAGAGRGNPHADGHAAAVAGGAAIHLDGDGRGRG